MVPGNERYEGRLYRALKKEYSLNPLSGRGAELHGGRFNPKGTPALYTSLQPETAMLEVRRAGGIGQFVMIGYRADQHPIFDAGNNVAMAHYGMSTERLADTGWFAAMMNSQPVPTHDFAMELINDGYAGLLVRSFVRGAMRENLNLVLWQWNVGNNKLKVESKDG